MSLGSPRVGTIHVQAPTSRTPALQAFLVEFSQQTTRFSHLLAVVAPEDQEEIRERMAADFEDSSMRDELVSFHRAAMALRNDPAVLSCFRSVRARAVGSGSVDFV